MLHFYAILCTQSTTRHNDTDASASWPIVEMVSHTVREIMLESKSLLESLTLWLMMLSILVSLAQRRQKDPTYQDAKNTNELVKLAQAGKGEPLRFTKVAENLDDLLLLTYHDAAWANAPLDPEVDDPEDYLAPGGQGVYSQLGHIMLMTSRGALTGRETPAVGLEIPRLS